MIWARLLLDTLLEEAGELGGPAILPVSRDARSMADPRHDGSTAF
jgi:hypothetical protein